MNTSTFCIPGIGVPRDDRKDYDRDPFNWVRVHG